MIACPDGNVLAELLELLKLEKIEENIFRGRARTWGSAASTAARCWGRRSRPPTRPSRSSAARTACTPTSCGRATSSDRSSTTWTRIRDGTSFTTRRVVAVQKGEAIFSMSASFQVDEPGFDHQDAAPSVPGPDGILSELESAMRIEGQIPHGRSGTSSSAAGRSRCGRVNPMNPFAPERREPARNAWFKTIDRMPDDPRVHQYLLAYASDYALVTTSLYPHGHSFWQPEMQVASLDHAMWFHRDFRMDDWLLYAMQSPNACKARGLAFGKIFTREGVLVASVAQEGLIRFRGKPKS